MILQSNRIWLNHHFMVAQLEIHEGKIVQVFPYQMREPDVDYGNERIVPGFIDIHTHGAYGVDANDGDEAKIKKWIEKITEEGVTSILPTTVTQSRKNIEKAVKTIAKVAKDKALGAEILGIHLEGPYLDFAIVEHIERSI